MTGRGVEVGTGRFDKNYLKYTYRVSTVPNTEYKFITSEAPYPPSNNTERELVNRHGIRILVTTAGRVGYFDFMTFLINLNVAAGLLGVSYVLMDLILARCWPQKELFQQFKERQTVSMTAFRRAIRGSKEVEARYRQLMKEKHIEDAHDAINQNMEALINQFMEGHGSDVVDAFSPVAPTLAEDDNADQPLLPPAGGAWRGGKA